MIGLVRGSNESPIAAYSPVVLLPVYWFALYGTRPELLISVICVGITYAIPSPALSSDGYPATEAIAALLWMVIAGIAGFTLRELVRQRELLATRLQHTARTDALTGLPNRRAWDEELEREILHSARTETPLCVALLDLDFFKQFNDLNGHPAGDSHLKEAASLWRDRLRAADLIARYGGEEFAVLLTATDAFHAQDGDRGAARVRPHSMRPSPPASPSGTAPSRGRSFSPARTRPSTRRSGAAAIAPCCRPGPSSTAV